MSNRKSGILLHISSLSGDEGIGTLGKEAFRFVEFLKECGQKLWQILPLGPPGAGNSPYQCYSAFAGNPMFIDLEKLKEEGLLNGSEIEIRPRLLKKRTEYDKVEKWKMPLLYRSFLQFSKDLFDTYKNDYRRFLDEHSWWLTDHALFMAARKHFTNKPWNLWDKEVKFRNPESMQKLSGSLSQEIEFQKYLQFIFFRQWHRLKEYANENNVEIVGDVPLYVSGDSSDIWANTDIFMLDKDLNALQVGGVPPDYFSETGQLWGNPVYNWDRLKKRDYDWWVARLHFNLNMFNKVRIDHFRGLESFWSIPASEKTAMNGTWIPAHGHKLLSKLKVHLGELLFIAEDLGLITEEVDKLREDFNLPGMKVLQFAFSTDATNKDLPHNYSRNFVVYTGTHDNNTTLGWLNSLEKKERENVEKYIGKSPENQPRKLIELAMASVADTAIIPIQDILELDEDARMNVPGTAIGNWEWRFQWKQLKVGQKKFLKELTEKYNR